MAASTSVYLPFSASASSVLYSGSGVVLRVHLDGVEHELAVLVVVAEAHEEPHAVGGHVGVVRGALGLHAVLGVLAALLLGDERAGHAPGAHMVEARGHLVAHAGAQSARIRAKDAGGQRAASVPVAEGDGRVARLVVLVGLRDGAHEAGTRGERRGVEALRVLHRAVLAVAAVLGPYELRKLLMQRLVVQAQALQRAVAQRRDEDISLGQEVHHNLVALGVLAVNSGPFLVERAAVVGHVVELALIVHAPGHALGALLVA